MWTAIAYIGAALIGALGTYMATQRTNQTSQEVSDQNIEFQQKENELTREREDNAMQRAAADYRAAGLSQTLAAGNPASAAALTAPQASYQNESGIGRAIEKANLKEAVLNLKSHEAEVAQTKAQTENIKAQTEATNLSNSTYMQQFANQQSLTLAQVEHTKAQLAVSESQAKLNQIEGEYRAESLSRQLDVLIAQNSNIRMSTHEISARVLNEIKKSEKLDQETALVVQDIINAKLKAQELEHNIDYAVRYDLPVGSMLNGNIGSIVNVIRSGGSQLLNGPFGFSGFDLPSNPYDDSGLKVDSPWKAGSAYYKFSKFANSFI